MHQDPTITTIRELDMSLPGTPELSQVVSLASTPEST